MGIALHDVTFLASAWKRGVRFDRTLTLGRQMLYATPEAAARRLRRYGLLRPEAEFARFQAESGTSADPLFRLLGAGQLHAIDFSDYEGATICHDLNQPVPPTLRNQFDVVYDGGTLEHVFNFPVAMESCMTMVRPEGRLFLQAPANNFFGHGFYQFSPELFYRLLGEENGFHLERLLAVESGFRPRWYEVSDPRGVGSRVELINRRPVFLLVQAHKIRDEPRLTVPQQSDYATAWKESVGPAAERPPAAWSQSALWRFRGRLADKWRRQHPALIRALRRLVFAGRRSPSFRNRRWFRPAKP